MRLDARTPELQVKHFTVGPRGTLIQDTVAVVDFIVFSENFRYQLKVHSLSGT